MNNRSNGAVSFNTVKRSHREDRLRRRRQGRITLLAICGVLILLAIAGLIFLICHIANVAKTPNEPPISDPNGSINGGTATVQYGQPVAKAYADTLTGDLILVNRAHEYQFPAVRLENMPEGEQSSYNLSTYLKLINGAFPYGVSSSPSLLQPQAAQALDKMLSDYYLYTGDSSIWAFVTYRTYEAQAGKDFPQGHSDHHTALLVSLTVDKSGKTSVNAANHAWIYENAHKYGFIQRFPATKAGLTGDNKNYTEAFRYVGVAHATYIKQNNLCLEEYVALLKNNHTSTSGTDGKHLSVDTNGDQKADYEIYYVPASNGASALTSVPVPSNYAYTISGDNCGGFIVTVDLNAPNS